MTSLAEMAAYMPVPVIPRLCFHFVDPSFGFAIGWNYWYNWAITIAAELAAAVLIMKFWFPDSPSILWSALALIIMFLLNYLSVKGFGEAEFWFAMIKIVTVIIFIITGFLIVFGIMGGNDPIGALSNFAMNDGPFNGGFFTILGVFMVAGFSFQGTELLGVTAGEVKIPRKIFQSN